jgi:hypothetical protein
MCDGFDADLDPKDDDDCFIGPDGCLQAHTDGEVIQTDEGEFLEYAFEDQTWNSCEKPADWPDKAWEPLEPEGGAE